MKEGMLEHCAGVCGAAARRAAELILREQTAAPGPDAT